MDTEDKTKDTLVMKQEEFETELKTNGLLIPGKDLFNYMVRNALYMELITSDEFLKSGIDLDLLVPDERVKEIEKTVNKSLDGLYFVTRKLAKFDVETSKKVVVEVVNPEESTDEAEIIDFPTKEEEVTNNGTV